MDSVIYWTQSFGFVTLFPDFIAKHFVCLLSDGLLWLNISFVVNLFSLGKDMFWFHG